MKNSGNDKYGNMNPFDKIADAESYASYTQDYYNFEQQFSKPFINKMIQLANVQPGQKVLDVGMGPGILALPIAEFIQGSGNIVGIDLSKEMIKTSCDTAKLKSILNAQFEIMDAENLDFKDSSFDTVVSMRAVHHIPNIDMALREMSRVLKPNGGFAISIGSKIALWGFGRMRGYAISMMREIRRRIFSDQYAPNFITRLATDYLREIPVPVHTSWRGSNPEKSLIHHIKKNGFSVENVEWLYNIVKVDSVEEFWRYQIAIVTEVRKRFTQASEILQQRFFLTLN